METFAVILLALFTFFAPMVAVLLIIDSGKRAAAVPLLIGGGLFTVAEACIVLPAINILGYNTFFNIVGIVIIEVLRWLVLGIYLRKTGYSIERIKYFFAGYAIVNLFVVWGIDALATTAVVIFDGFGLLEAGEVWISMLFAIIKVIMLYSYTIFAAAAIRQKQIRYVFIAMGIHIISDDNIIPGLCDALGINVGIGVTLLSVVACVMLVVNDKMSELWKGKENEN